MDVNFFFFLFILFWMNEWAYWRSILNHEVCVKMHENKVLELKRLLYGLKQTPKA